MTLNQYKTIINAFMDFYPDDRIDMFIGNDTLKDAIDKDLKEEDLTPEQKENIEGRYTGLHFTVYYPKITLTNDAGHTHDIYDVYVRHYFPETYFVLCRSTYTEDEVKVGYVHSHIRSGRFTDMTTFCTGGHNTPINTIVNKIRGNNYTDFNLIIQSYIIEVERTLKIESNEGVPYISFEDIGKQSKPEPIFVNYKNIFYPDFRYYSKKALTFKEFLKFYCSLRMDSFYYDGRSWQLDASDTEFITRVTKVAKLFKKTANKYYFFTSAYLINGLYYKKDHYSKYHLKEGTYVNWVFKNKTPKIKILKSTNEKAKEVQIASSDVLNSVYSFLINYANGIFADKYTFKDNIYSRAHKVGLALIKGMRE